MNHQKRLPLKLPSRLISHRLSIRELNPTDLDAFIDFLERDNRDYPSNFLGQDLKILNRDKAKSLMKEYQDQTIKDYYIFRIGNPNVIIGQIMVCCDRLRSPRIGYYTSRIYRRKGYCNEAYDTIITALTAKNKLHHIWAEIDWPNKASRHFLASRGFQHMGRRWTANYNLDEDSIVFRRKSLKPINHRPC